MNNTLNDYRISLWELIVLILNLHKQGGKKYALIKTGLTDSFVRWCLEIGKIGIHRDLLPNYIYELKGLNKDNQLSFIKQIRSNQYKTVTELRKAVRLSRSLFKPIDKGYSKSQMMINKQHYFNTRDKIVTVVE